MTRSPSEDPTLLLHAALDGELDAAGMIEIERRLAADPALAAEYARLVALRDAIRARAPRVERARFLARPRHRNGAGAEPPGAARRTAPAVAVRSALWRARRVAGDRASLSGPAATGCSRRRSPTTTSSVRSSPASSGADCPASRSMSRLRTAIRSSLGSRQGSRARRRSSISRRMVSRWSAAASTSLAKTPVATLVYQRREHQIALERIARLRRPLPGARRACGRAMAIATPRMG